MANWNQVKGALTAEGIQYQDDLTRISFAYDVGNGRSQIVALCHTPVDAADMITIMSPIAEANPSKATELLKKAFETPYGIAIDENNFFVAQTAVPLADLDISELKFFITSICVYADVMEQVVFGVDNF